MLPVYQMKKCSRYIEKWKWGWETSYSIVAEKQVNSRSKICGWLKCCLYGQCHLEWWLSWIFHQPFTWSYSGWVKSSKENLCNVSKPLREAFFTFYCVYRDFIISFHWECAIVFFTLNCHSKSTMCSKLPLYLQWTIEMSLCCLVSLFFVGCSELCTLLM